MSEIQMEIAAQGEVVSTLGGRACPRTVGFLLTRFFCKCPKRKVAKANKVGAYGPNALIIVTS